jgi:hypothetical protein
MSPSIGEELGYGEGSHLTCAAAEPGKGYKDVQVSQAFFLSTAHNSTHIQHTHSHNDGV